MRRVGYDYQGTKSTTSGTSKVKVSELVQVKSGEMAVVIVNVGAPHSGSIIFYATNVLLTAAYPTIILISARASSVIIE